MPKFFNPFSRNKIETEETLKTVIMQKESVRVTSGKTEEPFNIIGIKIDAWDIKVSYCPHGKYVKGCYLSEVPKTEHDWHHAVPMSHYDYGKNKIALEKLAAPLKGADGAYTTDDVHFVELHYTGETPTISVISEVKTIAIKHNGKHVKTVERAGVELLINDIPLQNYLKGHPAVNGGEEYINFSKNILTRADVQVPTAQTGLSYSYTRK